MKYAFTIGGGDPFLRDVDVLDGGADIVKGAVIVKGVTDGTNPSFAILAVASSADVIGVVENLVDASETVDSDLLGVARQRVRVGMNPNNVYLAEYDQTDTAAETSASSSTTFNCTSVEGIEGGFIYIVAGDAIGKLQYITADGTNSLTTKSALSPVTSGTDTFIKILPPLHGLVKLVTAADKIGSDAGAGTLEVVVLESYIQSNSIPFQRLDPTKHSGLTGLHLDNVKFYAEIMFRDHILNPLS